jgi:putative membrane protein
MMASLLHFLLSGALLFFISRIVDGFKIESYGYAVLAAIILSLVNALIRPLLLLLTLPITIVTLGLFLFVLNALMLMLAAAITPGFTVRGFGTALLASLIISLGNMVIASLIK